jgi:hypothetical protein
VVLLGQQELFLSDGRFGVLCSLAILITKKCPVTHFGARFRFAENVGVIPVCQARCGRQPRDARSNSWLFLNA